MDNYQPCDRSAYAFERDHKELTREQVSETVFQLLKKWDLQYLPFFRCAPEEREKLSIRDELDFDSLDMIELEMYIEKEFGVSFDEDEEKLLFTLPLGKQIDLIYAKTQKMQKS